MRYKIPREKRPTLKDKLKPKEKKPLTKREAAERMLPPIWIDPLMLDDIKPDLYEGWPF